MQTPEQIEKAMDGARDRIALIRYAADVHQADEQTAEARGYISALSEHMLIELEHLRTLLAETDHARRIWHPR